MKIKIENFGPVAEFEFDSSKSMHLIVGSNNVGKSYALTAYYFAVKALLDFAASIPRYIYQHDFIEDDSLFDKKLADEIYGKLKDKKSTNIDASKIFIETASVFLKVTLGEIFTEKLRSSFYEFETIANQFSRSDSTKIIFDLSPFKFTLKGDLDELIVTDIDFNAKIIIRTIKQNRAPVMRGKDFVIYRNENEKNEDVLNKIRRLAVQHATAYIIVALEEIADINYLPASRSGLYQALSAFSLIIAELSKNRSFITSKIELPGISGQLSDYFIKLAGISEENRSQDPSFEDLAGKIESTVLKGRIEYDYEKKKIYYRPESTDLRLDLSATSSMVSETGPIVAYIRHVISNKKDAEKRLRRFGRAKKVPSDAVKQILIIEEPEAHLHPENQIKMAQLYADLAKAGVNVIMTSHSNYIFNKISNIVISGELTPSTVRCDLFQIEENGSYGIEQLVDELARISHEAGRRGR